MGTEVERIDTAIAPELGAIGGEWGRPAVHAVALGSVALWERRNRKREVCMVVRRPNGKLLTFTKTFYPPGIFRLLTGGVEPDEGVIDALQREVAEETGLTVETSRFLALIAYFPDEDLRGSPRMLTFAFLLDEVGGTLSMADPSEHVESFGETDVPVLLTIANRLDTLLDTCAPEFGESWRDWGAFRAVVHRVVWQVLDGKL